MYRTERAKELNLPEIQIKEKDILRIIKEEKELSNERLHRLLKILEL